MEKTYHETFCKTEQEAKREVIRLLNVDSAEQINIKPKQDGFLVIWAQ